jgi:hypothetical protein
VTWHGMSSDFSKSPDQEIYKDLSS